MFSSMYISCSLCWPLAVAAATFLVIYSVNTKQNGCKRKVIMMTALGIPNILFTHNPAGKRDSRRLKKGGKEHLIRI